MSVVLASHFGKEIADLLGLKETREITITMRYDDFVMVNVEMLLTEEDGKKLTGFLQRKRFRLELFDEEEPVDLFAEAEDGVDTTKMGDEYRTRMIK